MSGESKVRGQNRDIEEQRSSNHVPDGFDDLAIEKIDIGVFLIAFLGLFGLLNWDYLSITGYDIFTQSWFRGAIGIVIGILLMYSTMTKIQKY